MSGQNSDSQSPQDSQSPEENQSDQRTGSTSDSLAENGLAEEESGLESTIRVGSPFAKDPFEADADRWIEAFHDIGPLRYTAMGAVSASTMVAAFAAAACYFFPIGGVLIAGLGCVLSLFGMYSSYRYTAGGLLAIHLCLFMISYGRILD